MRLDLRDHDGITNVHDRKYFMSLYVREPAGTLFEYATDGPGFLVDEAPETLGSALLIPPHDATHAQDLRAMLPQFAMPGEDRMPLRDLPFVHRFFTPDDPDGSVLVLLHGTGGNEADLMPLASAANPRATLMGVRGRSTDGATQRWFRRLGERGFDQDDIRSEAEAFDFFMGEATRSYGLDPTRTTFLGYSNGANFLAAVLRLYPGLIQRAILVRGGEVMENAPPADLAETKALLITGALDPFQADGMKLASSLTDAGAEVMVKQVEAGHDLTPEDRIIVGDWLTNA